MVHFLKGKILTLINHHDLRGQIAILIVMYADHTFSSTNISNIYQGLQIALECLFEMNNIGDSVEKFLFSFYMMMMMMMMINVH